MDDAALDLTFRKFRYHHGDLRGALIDTALKIVQTEGIEALSLRNLAKAVGVTAAAPYSHFRDKDELLAAVAETGFQKLALQMVEAATGQNGVQGRIEKLIAAYIRFAVENKALFHLMFGRELTNMKAYPTLAMTAGKSYSLFSNVLAKRAGASEEDTRIMTVSLWSMCHGIATLIMDGKINISQFGAKDIDAFVRQVAGTFSGKLV